MDFLYRIGFQFEKLGVKFVEAVPSILIGAIIFFIFVLIARIVGGIMLRNVSKWTGDPSLAQLSERLFKYIVYIVGAFIALGTCVPGFSVGNVITGLGLSGIVIGFAFKDLLENYLAGLYFLAARPFRIGNVLKTKDFTGTVETISARAIHVRHFNKELEVIPCSVLFKDRFTVVDNAKTRVFDFVITLDPDQNLKTPTDIVRGLVMQHPEVLEEPTPVVLISGISETGAKLSISYSLNTAEADVLQTRHQILVATQAQFEKAGVRFAQVEKI